ncbi:MAG: M20/M25/M40 family metallo-hydrolase [Candidatus Acidiferrales bacterium]
MNRVQAIIFVAAFAIASATMSAPVHAQSAPATRVPGDMRQDLADFVETPAVPGYEKDLATKIRERLKSFSPQTDNIGDVIVTIGSGNPRRLLVAPMDEPGYVVSAIDDDGYLRVQRLPQSRDLPLFNDLYAAQPIRLETSDGKWISGVVAGLSVHLQPGRIDTPKPSDLENFYVDIGASSREEARHAGADFLSPLAIARHLGELGSHSAAAAAIGDRFGDVALVEMLRELDPAKMKGTLTVAFVVQQWTGARGLQRVLDQLHPDELLYVGRLISGGTIAGMQSVRRAPRRELGSGVILGLTEKGETLTGFAAELEQLGELSKIPVVPDYSAPLISPSYILAPQLPGRSAHVGIATAWPSTPAEMIDTADLAKLAQLLHAYAEGSPQSAPVAFPSPHAASEPAPSSKANPQETLADLIRTYGASGHEEAVRNEIKRHLPEWAKTDTDDAGNLILHLGAAADSAAKETKDSKESKTPRILVVAHMDEIGFEVESIGSDGRLQVKWLGGGDLSFFAGHPALVHSSDGAVHDAIVELPGGWEQPDFDWTKGTETTGSATTGTAIHVDVGAHGAADVAKMGIRAGDWVTIPKEYRPLVGSRAIGRSFDDRVGNAALIGAVWALGPNFKDRDVTFVWSTREELGLLGAAAIAKRLAAEHRAPDYVFAVDTFVSSDSPLESQRFADAPLGKGFVIRAVDNSNVVPHDLVERLISLARQNKIPIQYGVTGGGNDGAAFTRYGSVDIPLGWPLRYAHSPAEVIDTRDYDALTHIITAIAKSW